MPDTEDAATASKYQPEKGRTLVGLCLSGGGFRAALFHLGALRRLNEVGLLSKINTISSVSGGSVASGLLAKAWPNLTPKGDGPFTNFAEVYESPLRKFCATNIRTAPLLWDRLDPRNWPFLWGGDHSGTDFLANIYRDHLVADLKLQDLAGIHLKGGPKFIFDSSNLQTGVNFEFGGERVGDYQIGHQAKPDFLVADAVAASSAFPIAFPPLVLKFDPGTFMGGDLARRNPPPADLSDMERRVVLTDGGVYDNLGLEPVWKNHHVVLCSDGGKPFASYGNPWTSFLPRIMRCQDLIGNQALAVRKRWLISSFEHKFYAGTYWGIGTEIDGYAVHDQKGYTGQVLDRLKAVRTDFDAFSEDEQLVLMNHGWMLADAALRSFVQDLLPKPCPPGEIPSSAHLDPATALRALAESDHVEPLGRG